MNHAFIVSGALLLALLLGPLGLYAYVISRLERPVPAFLAGSALLLAILLLTWLQVGMA